MKYRIIKNYKYELMEAMKFQLSLPDTNNTIPFVCINDNTLFLEKHYAWDGSSIPFKNRWRWVWNSDKYCKKASVVHDALCQLIRAGVLDLSHREYADGVYRDLCVLGGMSVRQADFRYWCLRKFGKSEVVKPENPIIEV